MVEETKSLAEFLTSLTFSDLSNNVVKYTKVCLLDLLGSALIGSTTNPAKTVVSLILELGGRPEATVIARGKKNSCLNAALANGVMSHTVELDDFHRGAIIHPGAAVIPAALAVAERGDVDGKTLITSVVAGYETAMRIGEAVGTSHYQYWHTTATCGTFGAAAAAAKTLGLDEDGMVNALGSAGTQASGLWQFIKDGSMSKHLHAGKAASNGVLSALLAQLGFTGAKAIIEGEMGFCKATSEDYDLTRVVDRLGETFKIEEVSIKPYASCRHTHSAIDAALAVSRRHDLNPEDIRRIKVRTYSAAVQIAGNPRPTTLYEARFSISYCVSIALIKGRVGLDEFDEELLRDAKVRALIRKVKVETDPEFDKQYPHKLSTSVDVEMVGGEVYSQSVDFPLGDPENPIGDEQLVGKFRMLASRVMDDERLESVILKVDQLEKLQSVREFGSLLL